METSDKCFDIQDLTKLASSTANNGTGCSEAVKIPKTRILKDDIMLEQLFKYYSEVALLSNYSANVKLCQPAPTLGLFGKKTGKKL